MILPVSKPITMEEYDLNREHQRLAALQTMRLADPDNVETLIRELFDAGTSKWTGWDEQFITFVENNRNTVLLYGSIGHGWHFLFAPAAGEGFWICASHTMTGKGFLRSESIAALREVAVEKHLFRR
ncbi:MAG: hypothetical protein V4819_08460 [Verrucomicrobiota bacterium]